MVLHRRKEALRRGVVGVGGKRGRKDGEGHADGPVPWHGGHIQGNLRGGEEHEQMEKRHEPGSLYDKREQVYREADAKKEKEPAGGNRTGSGD